MLRPILCLFLLASWMVAQSPMVRESSTQTLTNKTISGAANTITNVPSAALPPTADTNARVAVSDGGSLIGTRRGLNLIDGTGATVSCADNAGAERVDCTVAATGGGAAAEYVLYEEMHASRIGSTQFWNNSSYTGGTAVAPVGSYPSGRQWASANNCRIVAPAAEGTNSFPYTFHGATPKEAFFEFIGSVDTLSTQDVYIGFSTGSWNVPDPGTHFFGLKYNQSSNQWQALHKNGSTSNTSNFTVTPGAGTTHIFSVKKTTVQDEFIMCVDAECITMTFTTPTISSGSIYAIVSVYFGTGVNITTRNFKAYVKR